MRASSYIPQPATESADAHDPKLTMLAQSCVPKQGCGEARAETCLRVASSAASSRLRRALWGCTSCSCVLLDVPLTCQQGYSLKLADSSLHTPCKWLSTSHAALPTPIPPYHLPPSSGCPNTAFLCPCQRTGRGCPIAELRRLTPWGLHLSAQWSPDTDPRRRPQLPTHQHGKRRHQLSKESSAHTSTP